MNEIFHRFARRCSDATASPRAFAAAVAVLVIWAISGPFFDYSDTWQLTINTAASIVPTLMVFLIQNAQNRDARAMQLKIDELLADAEGPDSRFINLENLSDREVDRLAELLLRRMSARRDDTA
ncbi:MAG: low affinity iron permease family protein [Sphingomonas bacterium]